MSGDHEAMCKILEKSDKSDLALQNWSKWQEKWKKIQEAISQKLSDVPPGDLLMNYSEDIRQVNEEKNILEYAKIPTQFDKYRGKPDFYKLPDALSKRHQCRCLRGYCCKFDKAKKCCCYTSEPTYYTVKTKPECFIIPTIDLVGIPNAIKDDKNILNMTRNIYKKWQDGVYRQEQMDKLADKIQNIVPHWPNFEQLIVIGHGMERKETESARSNKSEQQTSLMVRRKSSKASQDLSIENPRLDFKINGISVTKIKGTIKIRLFFEHDISSSAVSVDFLNFVNSGLATLRITWKRIEKYRLFRNYGNCTQGSFTKNTFCFCKKELIILPGRPVKLPVWFESENSGHFCESWEIITNPRIWKEDSHVVVILESYAHDKNLEKKLEATVKYIDEESKKILIKDILNDCLEKVKYTEKPTVMCVFGEAELFEMANVFNGRPVYSFDRCFVENLKCLYEKVKCKEKKWNYCVNFLKKLAHKKDVSIYAQNKSTEIEEKIKRIKSGNVKESASKIDKVKKSHENVTKSSKDKKDSKSKVKKNKSSSKMSQPDKPIIEEKKEINKEPYEYYNQLELWNIVRNFDSPVIVNTNREKYFACYEIVGAYFTLMCHQLSLLQHGHNITQESLFPAIKTKLVPMNEQPERLIYEYFEHHYIPLHSYDNTYPFEVKRKPKILRDISSDDVESIYSKYFNKQIAPKKEIEHDKSKPKKDKKGKSEQDKSKTKKDKKGKSKDDMTQKSKKSEIRESKLHSKEKVVEKEGSVVSFNPYAENYIYVSDTEPVNPVSEEKSVLSTKYTENYKYQQYLIVYSCLSHAVDALVDTLESFDCVVSYSTLNEVTAQLSDNDGGQDRKNDNF